jgi:hypothetical protein
VLLVGIKYKLQRDMLNTRGTFLYLCIWKAPEYARKLILSTVVENIVERETHSSNLLLSSNEFVLKYKPAVNFSL